MGKSGSEGRGEQTTARKRGIGGSPLTLLLAAFPPPSLTTSRSQRPPRSSISGSNAGACCPQSGVPGSGSSTSCRSSRRKTRHTAHLDGFPATVRIVRRAHAWEGRSLELRGWMRRRGRLELILVLPDGSTLLVPAGWTDLQARPEPVEAGMLASLDDLLAVLRILEPLLERAVLAGRDDPSSRRDRAAASGDGREPDARGGVVGAGRRAAARGGDGAAGGVDRADGRARGGRR